MTFIIRQLAKACYAFGSVMGHLVAKFQLGWNQHHNPDCPGIWRH